MQYYKYLLQWLHWTVIMNLPISLSHWIISYQDLLGVFVYSSPAPFISIWYASNTQEIFVLRHNLIDYYFRKQFRYLEHVLFYKHQLLLYFHLSSKNHCFTSALLSISIALCSNFKIPAQVSITAYSSVMGLKHHTQASFLASAGKNLTSSGGEDRSPSSANEIWAASQPHQFLSAGGISSPQLVSWLLDDHLVPTGMNMALQNLPWLCFG